MKLAGSGWIDVDTEQKTSVPGVYAAGDVTALAPSDRRRTRGCPGGLGGELLPVPAGAQG
ncbi:FAD-dependent oxidoreductase [Streptomyces arenae]|uniref:FAD-dependent oxidoreductase n=1 Tax=Streptomyces arenae TaxID=29301 RepID=UPI0031BB355F